MAKKDVREIVREEIKEELLESGYARIANIMRGLIPNVKTFGIISAENPYGEELDKSENKKRNEKLEEDLKSMNLGFIKVKGKYGNFENSFFVPNIRKDELLELGKEHEQNEVVYGEKMNDSEYGGMNMQMLGAAKNYGKVIGERKVFVGMKGKTDNYTEVKGRKFQIPFFDENEFQDALFKRGYIDKNAMKKEDLQELEDVEEAVDDIFRYNKNAKYRWIRRGYIKFALSEKLNIKNHIFLNAEI